MGALWNLRQPILGGAGALLAAPASSARLRLPRSAWRGASERMRSRSPAIGSAGDASLAAAASLFKQHTGLALAAALLAGVFLGGER
jgi:hypothetical protein